MWCNLEEGPHMPDATAGSPLSQLSWKPADIEASLNSVRDYVEGQARQLIQWYYDKKRWKSRMSAGLRLLAIVFFSIGGLIPLIKAAFPPASIAALVPAGFDFGQLGYLLIALGAACIALDRFFGYSSGWIRYITTALVIERSVDEFRLDWTRSMAALQGSQPTAEQLDKLFHLCRQFAVGVRAQVEQETRAWVLEFQSSLSELERQLKSRAEDAKIPTGKGAPGGGAPGPDPQATSPDA
jgi:hypothetical protein